MSFDSLPGSPSLYIARNHGDPGSRPITELEPIPESDPNLNVYAGFYFPEADSESEGSPSSSSSTSHSPSHSSQVSSSPRGRSHCRSHSHSENASPRAVLLLDPIAYTRPTSTSTSRQKQNPIESPNTVKSSTAVRSLIAHTDTDHHHQRYNEDRALEDRNNDSYDDFTIPSPHHKTEFPSPASKLDVRNSMRKQVGTGLGTRTNAHTHQSEGSTLKTSPSWKN